MEQLKLIVLLSMLVGITGLVEDAAYWRRVASDDITRYLDQAPNTNIAKNVILFIGDGMGLSTVMAARVLKGQKLGNPGEETKLAFETLPNVGLSKVYTTNKQVPDSAATATAMLTGVKTLSRVLGVDNSITYDVCENITEATLSTMLHWSQTAGKSTGIVTTTRVTHATPAAAYAHVPNRNWESNRDVPWDAVNCTDIADQLIRENHDIKVILGGGGRGFIPNTRPNQWSGRISRSQRSDGRDLIAEWENDKRQKNRTSKFAWNKRTFDDVDPIKTDYLLGLFSDSHMSYELERDESAQPSIAEMTRKAIQVLQKNNKGFFLLVEGGRIDHAHHQTIAKKALYDTIAFDDAVNTAMNMTDESDTLIIVTADHSHVMTVAGYSNRGNGILDIARPSVADDDLPYTTLSYTNGPDTVYYPRRNLTDVETRSDYYQQVSAVYKRSETHSGEDVPIYSRGPMSHLLTGVKEQNTIAYVMAHAACVGNTGIPCSKGRLKPEVKSNGQSTTIETAPTTTKTACQNSVNIINDNNGGGQIILHDMFIYAIIIVITVCC